MGVHLRPQSLHLRFCNLLFILRLILYFFSLDRFIKKKSNEQGQQEPNTHGKQQNILGSNLFFLCSSQLLQITILELFSFDHPFRFIHDRVAPVIFRKK